MISQNGMRAIGVISDLPIKNITSGFFPPPRNGSSPDQTKRKERADVSAREFPTLLTTGSKALVSDGVRGQILGLRRSRATWRQLLLFNHREPGCPRRKERRKRQRLELYELENSMSCIIQ